MNLKKTVLRHKNAEVRSFISLTCPHLIARDEPHLLAILHVDIAARLRRIDTRAVARRRRHAVDASNPKLLRREAKDGGERSLLGDGDDTEGLRAV